MGLASPLPLPPPAPRLPPPNSEQRTYRAWKFSLFPSLPIFPNFLQFSSPLPLQPPSPSSPSPAPHPISPPFILSAPSLTLQLFWTWVSNWKCVYQQANSDGRQRVAHSEIEPETSIKQSPCALPAELFRLMRVTRFNLYIMTTFSSLSGCIIHIIISI